MKTINYRLLKGKDLFSYFLQDHPDKEYASIVALLPVATLWDLDKAFKLLERSLDENKQFIAVYPGIAEVNTTGMEFIGEIQDGALYLFFKGCDILQ